MSKFITIKCPQCGREYLPAEVYIPNSFFGSPSNIFREDGKILNFEGETMDVKESYLCDDCGTQFNITAKVLFTTSVDESKNMQEDYKKSFNLGLKLSEN